ncbi:ssk1 response regulator receiver [Apophysomyces ossiformis]|uniref:Ssk1 response regulator receiver n=1 Tax=Apophysomyces ossiformis TaxID=679940 RepID=A0A8H7BH54_9FUNG|nr:ssk1 response regulator receiver [Apophysomyces ossiformis]
MSESDRNSHLASNGATFSNDPAQTDPPTPSTKPHVNLNVTPGTTRPCLSTLRSAWSLQSTELVRKRNDLILLRPYSPGNDDPIVRVLHGVTNVSTTICLITSLVSCIQIHTIAIAFLVFWAAMVATRSRPNTLGPPIAFALAAIIFAQPTSHTYTQYILASLSIVGATMLGVADLAYRAHNEQKRKIEQHWQEQQQNVDKSLFKLLSVVSQEIQDTSLLIRTTLEQFSPSTILSNTHELLSACSIPVPIASISAVSTIIRQMCYISSHLQLLMNSEQNESTVREEFDTGELVQNVGDALAGIAAKLDVHLVIYHFDNVLHHTNVIGDEKSLKHALMNLLRDILEGCTPGACIELGLNVTTVGDTAYMLTIDIVHTASPAIPPGLTASLLPHVDATSRLLHYVGGTLLVDDIGKNQTKFEITLKVDKGPENTNQRLLIFEKPSEILEKRFEATKFTDEPTISELTNFISKLKGVKMALYAPERSVFAEHLTRCLASWNTDISHVPASCDEDGLDDASSGSSFPNSSPSSDVHAASPSPRLNTSSPQAYSPAIEEDHIRAIPPAFILIDDDVAVLEHKLRQFGMQRMASTQNLQQNQRHRRSKSSGLAHHRTLAVIFFASPANYKNVRDSIQWFSAVPAAPHIVSIPRVVIVPKPAGPRRFLTALHIGWNDAIVEPHFLPLATSPLNHMPPPLTSSTVGSSLQAGTPSTPNAIRPETQRASPSELLGRRTGGLLTSPAGLVMDSAFENGNYFSRASSPMMTTTATVKRRERSQSGTFQQQGRRALTDLAMSRPQSPGLSSEYVPTTLSSPVIHAPYDPVSPSGSPLKIAVVPSSSETSPNPSMQNSAVIETDDLFNRPVAVIADTVPSDVNTLEAALQPEPIPIPVPLPTPIRAKFKISQRRKKDKKQASEMKSPPIKVLIVEDNSINQVILSTWMKRHDIKYEVATDGKEAVDKWEGGGFHLVLMDIQLPVMNGIEATKKIRAIEKEQQIGVLPTSSSSTTVAHETTTSETTQSVVSSFRSPVIIVALTASSLEADRQAALAAGCNDFLTKPVSLEWLEKKIVEWGCMQALIDIEGWRIWKQETKSKSEDKAPAKQSKQQEIHAKKQDEEEKRVIAEVSPAHKGIVLPGAAGHTGKRRTSSMDMPHWS